MVKHLFYALLLVLSGSYALLRTTDISNRIKEKLKDYRSNNYPEKIYVHTDKPFYAVDETIWFTAYLVNGINHKPSDKSAVIHAEIIDEAGQILTIKRLYVDKVMAAGDFKIGKDWKEGTYTLRAYTQYMRNEDPEYLFQKTIPIWGVSSDASKMESLKAGSGLTSSSNIKIQNEKPDLEFYPEGGYLVDNVNSKIAFKIKNEQYHHSEFKGYITDDKGQIISNFSTLDFGLGLVNLTPKPKTNYTAHLEFQGTKHHYDLPKALPVGYTLSSNSVGTDLLVKVSSTSPEGLKGSYLVLHQRGEMLYDKLESQTISTDLIRISTKNIQDGVAHITLFNPQGNPVCERLVFIENSENKTTISITKDKEQLGTKEQLTLNLKVNNTEGSTIPSFLSLSVRDLDAVPHNDRTSNIKTWLLLNSDLRGKIEDPGYFFSKEADTKQRYLLDLVMMTHGWRRFTWQKILNDPEEAPKFPIEKGIMISGKTKSLESPETGIPTLTTLSFFGETVVEVPSQRSDEDGNFEFGPFIFYDSLQTIIQAKIMDYSLKNEAYRDVLISLNDIESTSPKTARIKKQKVIDVPTEDFIKVSRNINSINLEYDEERQRLEEVVLIAKKNSQKQLRLKEISNRVFFNSPSYRIDVEADSSLIKQNSVLLLLTQFPGLVLRGRGISQRGSSGNPKFLLNNLVVDLETVLGLQVTDISFIDYYRGAEAALYSGSADGVILIYTKLGVSPFSRNIKRKPGIINFMTEGFYTAKEFYAPDYSKETSSLLKADVRSTLHWEPRIELTNNKNTADITFYTCDIKGNYLIEIEGISESGIPLYQTSTFRVE